MSGLYPIIRRKRRPLIEGQTVVAAREESSTGTALPDPPQQKTKAPAKARVEPKVS